MHEPLNSRTYLRKKLFLNFWVPIFLHPKVDGMVIVVMVVMMKNMMMVIPTMMVVILVIVIGKNSLPQHEVSQKSFKVLKAPCRYSKKCRQLKGRNRTWCSKQLLGEAWVLEDVGDGLATSDLTKESWFTQLSDACY